MRVNEALRVENGKLRDEIRHMTNQLVFIRDLAHTTYGCKLKAAEMLVEHRGYEIDYETRDKIKNKNSDQT